MAEQGLKPVRIRNTMKVKMQLSENSAPTLRMVQNLVNYTTNVDCRLSLKVAEDAPAVKPLDKIAPHTVNTAFLKQCGIPANLVSAAFNTDSRKWFISSATA
ncbi:hypothetical protein GQ600_7685 [Phytophthora cactorum]|nr:hypothetical protein GQ600_7685 [Phytophthora cactorum]